MGTHSARRPRAMSGSATGIAGRGLFTATAAVALVGGSAGVALAGEATSHGQSHEQDQQDCRIPVVDQGTQTVGHVLNGATGGATGPVLDAGDRALAPAHDAVCPPAHDILGQLPELGGQSGSQDEAQDEQASSDEGTAEEGSEEGTADESPDGGSEAPTVAAPGGTSTTDLPVEAPGAA